MDLRFAVGAYLLQGEHRSRKVDLTWMVEWAAANGLLFQLSSGEYAGRYVVGPGQYKIIKKWSEAADRHMVCKLPRKHVNNYYLLPAPDKSDVAIRWDHYRPTTEVHRLAELYAHPMLLDPPRYLHREYGPPLARGTVERLMYHFPSEKQGELFWSQLQKERAHRPEPGTCAHFIHRTYLTDYYPYKEKRWVPCELPTVEGSPYCACHQSWGDLIPAIEEAHQRRRRYEWYLSLAPRKEHA